MEARPLPFADPFEWRWRVIYTWISGINQGCEEVHSTDQLEGRGDTPQEAINAICEDVDQWTCLSLPARRQVLRDLLYALEDTNPCVSDWYRTSKAGRISDKEVKTTSTSEGYA